MASNQPAAILHSYVYFTGVLKRSGGDPFARPCTHLISAMSALARSYAGDASKPVWVQEYGMSEDWMDKAGIPRFLEETTIRSIEGGATWFTWWASHDIDQEFTFAPLEYCLGLISLDQKIKPQGEAFRRLAEAYRGRGLDKAALALMPLKSPPVRYDHEGTWQWLDEWLRDFAGPMHGCKV
jgi:hypothetical protein